LFDLPTDRTRGRRRFPLFEIAIVVASVAVLHSIVSDKAKQGGIVREELEATEAITAIHTAQKLYRAQFGHYAASFRELGAPASQVASGYKFTLQNTPDGYKINADPKACNETGRRTLYSDHTIVLRHHWGQEPATEQSQEIKWTTGTSPFW